MTEEEVKEFRREIARRCNAIETDEEEREFNNILIKEGIEKHPDYIYYKNAFIEEFKKTFRGADPELLDRILNKIDYITDYTVACMGISRAEEEGKEVTMYMKIRSKIACMQWDFPDFDFLDD